jgi:hypothetical protein
MQPTKKEQSQIAWCELQFARVHPEWNYESNFDLIRSEMNRLFLPADKQESYEIAAMSLGNRLCKRAPEPPPPAPEEKPATVSTDEVLAAKAEAPEEVPTFKNTKQELKAMIRRNAEKQVAASIEREKRRQHRDPNKQALNPASVLQSFIREEK